MDWQILKKYIFFGNFLRTFILVVFLMQYVFWRLLILALEINTINRKDHKAFQKFDLNFGFASQILHALFEELLI